MTQVTIADLENAALDCETIAEVATSSEDTVLDRLGNPKRTLTGAINALGYIPPVLYASSLSMTASNQTVEYSGGIYAPKPSELPFTTSGTFEVAKFLLVSATTAVVPDNAVSTAKIVDEAVTDEKLAATLDLTGKTVTVDTATGTTDDDSAASTAMVQAAITARVASDTEAGISEHATEAEYATGTDPDRVLTVAVARAGNVVAATAQAATSGTTKDFTDIPAWVKRITGSLSGVSNAAGNAILLQIGDSGGLETTGYECTATTGGTPIDMTSAFIIAPNVTSGAKASGHFTLTRISGNTWVFSAVAAGYNSLVGSLSGGTKTLSATLDRLRFLNGAGDAFDAGSINIFYE